MKKKIVACILCAQMVLSQLTPIVWSAPGTDQTSALQSTKSADVQSTQKSIQPLAQKNESEPIFPASQLLWMSYEDFVDEEARKAWNYPDLYIGYTAVFNVDYWSGYYVASEFWDGMTEDDYGYVYDDDLMDEQENSIKVVITDYYYEEATDWLWYKVEAAEGYTLPEAVAKNPYVMHLDCSNYADGGGDIPSLLILPKQGMFLGDTVMLQKQAVSASRYDLLNVADLPDFFDAEIYNDGTNLWYDLGDVSSWTGVTGPEYRYVSASDVLLIPAEATVAYETLMATENTVEFFACLREIPTRVRALFSDKHQENVFDHLSYLTELESVTYSASLSLGGVNTPVTVKGKIPETGVTLSVSAASAQTVLDEGFDIQDASEIIAALDIKITNDVDGTPWQPEEELGVSVSIGIGALGYADGSIVRMHHKHGDTINTLDVFVVTDGAVTIQTGGFSLYVVTNTTSTQNTLANPIQNNGSYTMTVGEEEVFYAAQISNVRYSSWTVTDTLGAVYYTVHTNDTLSGHNGIAVPWIKIVPLKETTQDAHVTLTYNYYTTGNATASETFTIYIQAPKASAAEKKHVYLKDDVNHTGRIVATLVDQNGKEIEGGLDGAAFSWKRDDGYFIVPSAYDDDYRGVNIARDHGGLVEARKQADGSYKPVTYTVTVTLADGQVREGKYTVYYQSEIINSSFEAPNALNSNYSFFPNGWPNLYWQTTAQGRGDQISRDIEYGDVTGGRSDVTTNGQTGTDYGPTNAADHANGGVQFAEINAEEIGALYQDIITAPGEDIDWSFAHAPRRRQSWATDITNRLFIVMGATEGAQTLDHDHLKELCAAARAKGGAFLTDPTQWVEITYNGATYCVWFHDAGVVEQNVNPPYSQANNYGWTLLQGSYTVPEGQYRTRLFFVSETDTSNNHKNAGNLIDNAKAGQYKTYLIEYYEETFVDGNSVLTHKKDYDESGEAIVYSSVSIENLDHFITEENDYLHQILINGSNYPYNIRYTGDASLYIEKYPGNATYPIEGETRDYSGYDIVMQIYVRDTVIAVQKIIDFPAELTQEQKLKLIENLAASGGYTATFQLTCVDDGSYTFAPGNAVITQRDPAGNYTGYISLGDNPQAEHQYVVEETYTTPLVGLELDSVTLTTTTYSYGVGNVILNDFWSDKINAGQPIVTGSISLSSKEGGSKIAEVQVINHYVEKMTTVYYAAVGNGKVALIGATNFQDTPTEDLKFYSGKAIGAAIHPGKDATFVGWFKDAACTIPVTSADGVVGTDGSFKPNTNIINADEVTFYAKFATGSLTIKRENAQPGQVFVYHIHRDADGTNAALDLYVTVECNETGKGEKQILEALLGKYTVTECEDWTWRYPSESQTQSHKKDQLNITFTFDEARQSDQWLNGYSDVEKNVYNNG